MTTEQTLCGDCPPVGYPTDKTRCLPCPRRTEQGAPEAGATTALRDEIARIIDPHSFCDIPFTDEQVLLDMVEQSKRDAERKADRILAALAASPSPPPVGVQSGTPFPGDDIDQLLSVLETIEYVAHNDIRADGMKSIWDFTRYAKALLPRIRSAAPPVGGEVVKLEPMYVLAASLRKSIPNGFVSSIMLGWRRGLSEDAAKDSFLSSVQREKPSFSIDELLCSEVPSALVPSSPSLLGPRFKIRQLGEIEFEGVDGKPEHINGLVLEALSDDDVRAAGSLFGQTVTVGASS